MLQFIDKGGRAIIHPVTGSVCFTDDLPEQYNRGSANIICRFNETDLVMIDVTATDKSGDYVRDLRPDEIQVF